MFGSRQIKGGEGIPTTNKVVRGGEEKPTFGQRISNMFTRKQAPSGNQKNLMNRMSVPPMNVNPRAAGLTQNYPPKQQARPKGAFADNVYGQLTQKRPENYYGDKFIPPEMIKRMTGTDFPTRKSLNTLEDTILPKTRKARIPDAVPAAQWSYESQSGTSEDARLRNNPFGLGPHNTYDSVDDATQVYINTVLNNSGLGEKDASGRLVLKAGITAEQLLDALAGKYEMHKANKWDAINEQKRTPAWRFYNQ